MQSQIPPKKIGRYAIKAVLGRGGMAIVYLGYDPETDREVAVKVMKSEDLYRDTDTKARFRREVKTVARFDDPGIVPLYDVGEENGQPYFVMRYMRGGTLDDKLKDGPYSLEKALRLLEQIAPGLDEAHNRGIIHRDLKPGNILFDGRGKPGIADFGVAKIVKTNPTFVTNDGTPGTPAYMAPEQIMGGDVDGRADVYSLGIILYQVLTGKLPFEAHMRNIGAATRTTVPSILDENPALPPWVEAVISKAMAGDRAKRYQTVGELVEAIKSQFNGSPAPAQEQTPNLKRLPAPVLVTTFILTVSIASYMISQVIPSRLVDSTETQSSDITPTATNTKIIPSKTATEPSATLTPSATVSPAPSLPVMGGADKIAVLNNNNIWVMNVDGSDLRAVTNDKTEKFNLEWLPDGKRLLYITGKTIMVVDIETKEQEVITSFGASDYFEAFRISPDGKQVAISLARELHVVPFDLAKLKQTATKDDLIALEGCLHYTAEEVEDMRWSDDGEKLAIKFAASTIRYLKDYIRIIDIQYCDESRPFQVDEFPGSRFEFFTDDIVSYNWNGENREDGNSLFIINSDKRNDGFGRLGIYNSAKYLFYEIFPIEGICCYRDATFSPDGTHVLFAFQDIRLGAEGPIELYNLPVTSLQTEDYFQPIPLPEGFFVKRSDTPSPVFRPAK